MFCVIKNPKKHVYDCTLEGQATENTVGEVDIMKK
jgi:hypothetical protein